jgi:hypothetical protein
MKEKNESGLKIDCPKVISEIEGFIKSKVESLNRRGVVLGLSGGLDSTVVAYLGVRSLGNQEVFGLFLPERDSSPESEKNALLVADKLGIKLQTKSLTENLKNLGTYSTPAAKTMKSELATHLLHKALSRIIGINPFFGKSQRQVCSTNDKIFHPSAGDAILSWWRRGVRSSKKLKLEVAGQACCLECPFGKFLLKSKSAQMGTPKDTFSRPSPDDFAS